MLMMLTRPRILSSLPSFWDVLVTSPCSFNKEESDFSNKQEFDDYLEEREDISECHSKHVGCLMVAIR